jgi:molecular chaperone DnaK
MGNVMTRLIEANSTIPAKKSQVFSTAADNQPSVEIHVLQGERAMATDNKTIGRFHLDGIPPSPRGVPQIEVTFDIDANGILNVSAKDKTTGKEQKIRIEASSGLSKEDIEKMKQEAQANSERDKQFRDEAEKLNAADNLIFSSEKQLSEYGDKLPDEKKSEIRSALDELKSAHGARQLAEIDAATERLNKAWEAASAEMYKATQEAGAADAGAGSQSANGGSAGAKDSEQVTDVDFEEVK